MYPAAGATDYSTITAHLAATQPWVRFMSILGFLSAGLMIVAGLGFGAIGLVTDNLEAAVLLVVYPILGVLYVFPSLYLYRYADCIRRFVAAPEHGHLATALDAQRSFWKFIGILSAISVGVAVLGFVLALAVGVAAGLGGMQN